MGLAIRFFLDLDHFCKKKETNEKSAALFAMIARYTNGVHPPRLAMMIESISKRPAYT